MKFEEKHDKPELKILTVRTNMVLGKKTVYIGSYWMLTTSLSMHGFKKDIF